MMRPPIPMKPPGPGPQQPPMAPPAPDKLAQLQRQGIDVTQRPAQPPAAPPPAAQTYPSGITRSVPPPSATPGYTTPPSKPQPPPGAAYARPPMRGPRAVQATNALGWQSTGSPLAQPEQPEQ